MAAKFSRQDNQISPTDMMEEFRAGLTACLRSWSALHKAVESGWGGVESEQKANDLRSNILQYFDGSRFPPRLALEDLEDNLAIYMEEEFSIVLEDGSDRQVAETIYKMYEDCYKGDATFARSIVALAENAIAVESAFPSKIQSSEHDEDDGDDDMMDADGVDDNDDDDLVIDAVNMDLPAARKFEAVATINFSQISAADYASASLFGACPGKKERPLSTQPVRQLGEQIPESATTPAAETDEDGFAPVSKKGRRKPAV